MHSLAHFFSCIVFLKKRILITFFDFVLVYFHAFTTNSSWKLQLWSHIKFEETKIKRKSFPKKWLSCLRIFLEKHLLPKFSAEQKCCVQVDYHIFIIFAEPLFRYLFSFQKTKPQQLADKTIPNWFFLLQFESKTIVNVMQIKMKALLFAERWCLMAIRNSSEKKRNKRDEFSVNASG